MTIHDWQHFERHYSKLSQYSSRKARRAGARLQVKWQHKFKYDQRVQNQYQTFVNSGIFKPTYFSSNQINEKSAILKRVLELPQQPDPLIQAAFIQYVKDNLFKVLPRIKIKPVSFEDYLANSNARPSVKNILRQTYSKLSEDGFDFSSKIDKGRAYEYTRRKSFVKVENVCYGSRIKKLIKAPRLIQGAAPEFVCSLGPFFQAFQGYMKDKWGKKNFIYYTSGANNLTMGDFVYKRREWNIFENDVSAWDSSLSPEICNLEVWIAKKFGASPLIIQLMIENIKTHGYTMNGCKYSVKGTRKSGDPFTSCFNSLINAMLHLFAFQFYTNRTIENLKSSIGMLVQGDDNLLMHSFGRVDVSPLFLQLGFVTVSKYRQIYNCEFCSSIITESKSSFVFVPKLGKVVMKCGYFINPPLDQHPDQVLAGIKYGFAGLRSMATYWSFLGTLPEHKNPYFQPKLSHTFEIKTADISERFIQLRYDFSHEMWLELAKQLRNHNLDHPYVQAIFDLDTDGVKELYISHN